MYIKVRSVGIRQPVKIELISDDYRPTQRPWSNWAKTSVLPTMLSLLSHRKGFAVYHFLLHRSCPALCTRSQFKEDRSIPLACISVRQPPSHITIGVTELKVVYQFTYLGCTITSGAKIDKEVDKSGKGE